MNLMTSRHLHLPLSLLTLGLLIPAALIVLVPEAELFLLGLPHWISSWVYLALSLLAIRLTLQSLVESSLPTGNCSDEVNGLQAHSRTAELLIMGIALLSLSWGKAPDYIEDAMLFISMRLGITLLLLGGVVLTFTHIKMRGLQGE